MIFGLSSLGSDCEPDVEAPDLEDSTPPIARVYGFTSDGKMHDFEICTDESDQSCFHENDVTLSWPVGRPYVVQVRGTETEDSAVQEVLLYRQDLSFFDFAIVQKAWSEGDPYEHVLQEEIAMPSLLHGQEISFYGEASNFSETGDPDERTQRTPIITLRASNDESPPSLMTAMVEVTEEEPLSFLDEDLSLNVSYDATVTIRANAEDNAGIARLILQGNGEILEEVIVENGTEAAIEFVISDVCEYLESDPVEFEVIATNLADLVTSSEVLQLETYCQEDPELYSATPANGAYPNEIVRLHGSNLMFEDLPVRVVFLEEYDDAYHVRETFDPIEIGNDFVDFRFPDYEAGEYEVRVDVGSMETNRITLTSLKMINGRFDKIAYPMNILATASQSEIVCRYGYGEGYEEYSGWLEENSSSDSDYTAMLRNSNDDYEIGSINTEVYNVHYYDREYGGISFSKDCNWMVTLSQNNMAYDSRWYLQFIDTTTGEIKYFPPSFDFYYSPPQTGDNGFNSLLNMIQISRDESFAMMTHQFEDESNVLKPFDNMRVLLIDLERGVRFETFDLEGCNSGNNCGLTAEIVDGRYFEIMNSAGEELRRIDLSNY